VWVVEAQTRGTPRVDDRIPEEDILIPEMTVADATTQQSPGR
jgi:hypothetical protein